MIPSPSPASSSDATSDATSGEPPPGRPASPPSVFLVGPMGSGKTAVGRLLARLLRYRFLDSDAEIEARTGVDIALIFEKEGEAGFRLREREVIEDLTRRTRTVVATGGGAILLPENRAALVARGVVVYLETSPDLQAARTHHGRHRPLLQGQADPRARLQELMRHREPLYRGTAHVTVATDGRRVPAVAEEIVAALTRHGVVPRAGALVDCPDGPPPRHRSR